MRYFFIKNSPNYLNKVENLNEQIIVKEDNSDVIKKEEDASSIIDDLSYKNIDYKGNIFNIKSSYI